MSTPILINGVVSDAKALLARARNGEALALTFARNLVANRPWLTRYLSADELQQLDMQPVAPAAAAPATKPQFGTPVPTVKKASRK